MKLSVFRNGSVDVGNHDESYFALATPADARRPEGRTGRSNCVYASPDLAGVARWTQANLGLMGHLGMDLFITHEVKVEATGLFVYSIKAWDKVYVARNSPERFAAAIDAYWASGIALADFAEVAAERGLDSKEWEVLVPVESIISTRGVSSARQLSAVADEDHREGLARLLKRQTKELNWLKAVA